MELGKIYMTQRINAALLKDSEFASEIPVLLKKYSNKDWGITPDNDIQENNKAFEHGDRIIATYETSEGNVFIITEADRTITTILFPDEY